VSVEWYLMHNHSCLYYQSWRRKWKCI